MAIRVFRTSILGLKFAEKDRILPVLEAVDAIYQAWQA